MGIGMENFILLLVALSHSSLMEVVRSTHRSLSSSESPVGVIHATVTQVLTFLSFGGEVLQILYSSCYCLN